MCLKRNTLTGCTQVAKLVAADPEADALLVLGDAQYDNGTLTEYQAWFASRVDGVLGASRVRPVPGNHDYTTSGAPGYYDYFGNRAGGRGKGWHTFTLGGWRFVAANSQCNYYGVGGCGPNSTQGKFITTNLDDPAETCEIVYAHHPIFSDGSHGDSIHGKTLFTLAYNSAAEIYLAGHDHNYQRFTLTRPDGSRTSKGVRSLVVGTGGGGLTGFTTTNRSVYRQASKAGAVRLVLTDTGYTGKFIAIDGTTMDSFSGPCR
jgi:hypothetical protein